MVPPQPRLGERTPPCLARRSAKELGQEIARSDAASKNMDGAFSPFQAPQLPWLSQVPCRIGQGCPGLPPLFPLFLSVPGNNAATRPD